MRNLLVIGICACGLGAAADPPYAGNWRMNPAKSDFGAMTVNYEQLPGGEIKATADGQSFTFKTDGKEVMTPWGVTQAWKTVNDKTWEVTETTNGKVTGTSKVMVSADGKALNIDTKRIKPEGGTSDDTVAFQRISGGPGLAGKWKTRRLTSSSPDTLSLTPKGSVGLAIAISNGAGICDARFDGRDYPATGSAWPPGWTCAIAQHGAKAIDVTWKREGKPMYKSTMAGSDDGKVLTETGSAVGLDERFTILYDRM
jgi:hypothetical protein